MSQGDDLRKRFGVLLDLSEADRDILEELRARENRQAARTSTVLTYSGLLIAACLVQYTAPATSIVSLNRTPEFTLVSIFGFTLLNIGAIFSVFGMNFQFKRIDSVQDTLIMLDKVFWMKAFIHQFAYILCGFGSIMTSLSLLYCVLQPYISHILAPT